MRMEKFVPYEKISKKKKKEQNDKKRVVWGLTPPSTRQPKNPKAYDRNSEKKYTLSEVREW